MSPEEFLDLLSQDNDPQQLLNLCLHDEATPFAFGTTEAWDSFRDFLAQRLDVVRGDIRVIGSARFGFSMKPRQKLRRFQDDSDIDVVVVNEARFDELWHLLLQVAYPRPPVTQSLGGWLRRVRNEVYTGWLTPLSLRLDPRIFGQRAAPIIEITGRWFEGLRLASQYPIRRHEDVQGRLYRTWRHAELYHLHSLAELRRSIAEEGI